MAHRRLPAVAVLALATWGQFLMGRPRSLALLSLVLLFELASRRDRRAGRLSWPLAIAPLVTYSLNFCCAWDYQGAVGLGLLLPLALASWGLGAVVGKDVTLFRGSSAVIALASMVALDQVFSEPFNAQDALHALPESLRDVAQARLNTGRAFGTLPLPGHFAALQAFAAPFLVSWTLQGSSRNRLLAAGLSCLSLAGCVATRSLLGTGLWVLGAFLVLGVAQMGRRVVLGITVAALAGVVIWREDLARLEPLVLRWVNWKVSAWALWKNPIFGVGPGGIGVAGLTSPWAEKNLTPFSHNTFLQLVAEFGLIGLPLVGFVLARLVGLIRRLWITERAVAVALLVVLLHNFLDFSFYEPGVLVPFGVLAGAFAENPIKSVYQPRWYLASLLLVAAGIASLEGVAQDLSRSARRLSAHEAVPELIRASSFVPWRLSEILEAAGIVWKTPEPKAARQVDEALRKRAWVAPESAAYAQARAMLSFVQGGRAEAWSWAREAVRRAPSRQDLRELEQLCRP